jgi:hypothetical protein
MGSKLSAVALLAVVFLVGGSAGWLLHDATDHDDRPRRRGPDAMVAYLTKELTLTPAQADSVRAIFARHRPEIEALSAQVRPKFDSIRTVVRGEIDAQLTPDQRTKHARLTEEAEHRRRGDSTKAKPEGGRN